VLHGAGGVPLGNLGVNPVPSRSWKGSLGGALAERRHVRDPPTKVGDLQGGGHTRRVVGRLRRPPWARLFYVPVASTMEGARFYALLRRCLHAEVSGDLRWSCVVPLGGCCVGCV
jgi:hypothetical protein